MTSLRLTWCLMLTALFALACGSSAPPPAATAPKAAAAVKPPAPPPEPETDLATGKSL